MKTSSTSKRASVRARILDEAEKLYADFGLNGVSLRQISSAAGARNTNAVQYHFGSAEGLVRAILERHAADLERQRAALLARYAGHSRLSVRQLLEVLYQPLLNQAQAGEASIFARFSLAMLTSPMGWNPLVDVFLEQPATKQALDMIVELNQPVPAHITYQRLLHSAIALLTYAVNTARMTTTRKGYEAALKDAFAMAATGLEAPLQEDAEQLDSELQRHFSGNGQGSA